MTVDREAIRARAEGRHIITPDYRSDVLALLDALDEAEEHVKDLQEQDERNLAEMAQMDSRLLHANMAATSEAHEVDRLNGLLDTKDARIRELEDERLDYEGNLRLKLANRYQAGIDHWKARTDLAEGDADQLARMWGRQIAGDEDRNAKLYHGAMDVHAAAVAARGES